MAASFTYDHALAALVAAYREEDETARTTRGKKPRKNLTWSDVEAFVRGKGNEDWVLCIEKYLDTNFETGAKRFERLRKQLHLMKRVDENKPLKEPTPDPLQGQYVTMADDPWDARLEGRALTTIIATIDAHALSQGQGQAQAQAQAQACAAVVDDDDSVGTFYARRDGRIIYTWRKINQALARETGVLRDPKALALRFWRHECWTADMDDMLRKHVVVKYWTRTAHIPPGDQPWEALFLHPEFENLNATDLAKRAAYIKAFDWYKDALAMPRTRPPLVPLGKRQQNRNGGREGVLQERKPRDGLCAKRPKADANV